MEKIEMVFKPSEREIFRLLKEKRDTPKGLQDRTEYAPRTINNALRELFKEKKIGKYPNLMDMRQPIYYALEVGSG